MNMGKIIITSCLVTLLLIPQALLAANIPESFTISPQIGGYMFEGNQDGRLDDALVYSIAVGYNFDKNFSAELGYSYINTETESGRSNSINSGRLDLLYHFMPEKNFVPFVIAGIGLSHANLMSDDDLIPGYGVGFKYFLSDTVALRAEVKHILDFNYNDVDNTQSFYNNLSATVGFTFQLTP